MIRPSLPSSASRRTIGRNLALDVLVAVGMGVTMALISSILPTVARRGGLAPIGLSALAAAPFVANLLGAFAGRFGPRNTAQLGLVRGLGAAALLVSSSCRPRRSSSRSRSSSGSASRSAARSISACGAAMYPARLRGRVVGVLGMGRAAAGALAAFIGGVLADGIGGEQAVAIAGIVGVACAIGYLGLPAPPPPSSRVRTRPASPSARCAIGPPCRGSPLAQGFYGGGLIAAVAAVRPRPRRPAEPQPRRRRRHRHPDRRRDHRGLPVVGPRRRPVRRGRRAADGQRDRAALARRLRRRAVRRRPLVRRDRGRDARSASIDVGIAAAVSDQTPLASRAAAMAGWNALTGARGIVAAFLMSVLLQIGLIDVTVGLLPCAATSAIGVAMFVRAGRVAAVPAAAGRARARCRGRASGRPRRLDRSTRA